METEEKDSILNFSQLNIIGTVKLENIIDLKIEREVNEHTKAYIVGMIREDEKEQYIHNITQKDEIGITYALENEKPQQLFCGSISKVEIMSIEGIFYACIEALSGTNALDIKRKRRSFPKNSIKYTDILKQIKKEYAEGDFIENLKENPTVDRLIVQYEETDFQLIKRLASHLGTVVVSEDLYNKPRFYFGIPQREEIILEKEDYTVTKNFALFNDTYYNHTDSARENDFTSQEIVSGRVLFIGDTVIFNNRKLVVAKAVSEIIKSHLIHTYTLVPEKGLGKTYIENTKIKGSSIEGKVLEIQDASIKVQLNIDIEKVENWFRFPIESSNVMYSMPYEGDTIQVHFPSTEEEEAIARAAVYKAWGAEEMLSPDTKYWSNKQGRKIQFKPQSIEFKVKDDKVESNRLLIKLDNEEGIEITSHQPIKFSSSRNLSLRAKNINLLAQDQISLISSQNALSGINPVLSNGIYVNKIDISIKGVDTIFSGYERIAYPFEQEARPKLNPTTRNKTTEKKKKWGKVLIGIAIGIVVISAAVFVISASGGAMAPVLAKAAALLIKAAPVLKAAATILGGGLLFAGLMGRGRADQRESAEKSSEETMEEILEEGKHNIMFAHPVYPSMEEYKLGKNFLTYMYANDILLSMKNNGSLLPWNKSPNVLGSNAALQKKAAIEEEKPTGIKAGVIYVWDRGRAFVHGGINTAGNIVKGSKELIKTSFYGWGMVLNTAVLPFDEELYNRNMDYLVEKTEGFRKGVDYCVENFWDIEKNVFTGSIYYVISNGDVFLDSNTPYEELVTYCEEAFNAALILKAADKISQSTVARFQGIQVVQYMTPEGIIINNLVYDAGAAATANTKLVQGITYMAAGSGSGDTDSRNKGEETKEENGKKEEGKDVFKKGFDEHLIEVQGVVRKGNKGIVGGHNLDNFKKVFADNGWNLDECIISKKAHPDIKGIYEIEYKLPALNREGNIVPGQFKNISTPKTVYDPNIISNEQMLFWGKEAMTNGIINGRVITGYSTNGLKFQGFIDEATSKITNFFPTLD